MAWTKAKTMHTKLRHFKKYKHQRKGQEENALKFSKRNCWLHTKKNILRVRQWNSFPQELGAVQIEMVYMSWKVLLGTNVKENTDIVVTDFESQGVPRSRRPAANITYLTKTICYRSCGMQFDSPFSVLCCFTASPTWHSYLWRVPSFK